MCERECVSVVGVGVRTCDWCVVTALREGCESTDSGAGVSPSDMKKRMKKRMPYCRCIVVALGEGRNNGAGVRRWVCGHERTWAWASVRAIGVSFLRQGRGCAGVSPSDRKKK